MTHISFRRHWPILVVLLIGLTATYGIFRLTSGFEHARSERELARATDGFDTDARDTLEDLGQVLVGLNGLYAASDSVDRDEFALYASLVRERVAGIQALEWVPAVDASEVDQYRIAAADDGVDGFTIRERSPEGDMIPAASRDTYYPIFYLEPFVGNETALGFDLGSEPTRRSALENARDTGENTAVPVTLVQEAASQTGLLLFSPVYRNGAPTLTIAARREALEGFVLGVYRIGDLLAPVVAHAEASQLSLRVFDFTGEQELQISSGSDLDSRGESLAELQSDSDVQFSEVRVADQIWLLAFTHHHEGVDIAREWLVPAATGASLLIVVLATVSVATSIGRARRVDLLVNQRTAQLTAAQSAVQEEHRQSEQVLSAIESVLIGIRQDGTINLWNHAAEQASGVDPATAIGASIESVPSPCLQQPQLMEAVQRCLADGGRQHLTRVPYETLEDQPRYMDVAVTPVTDAHDEQTGALLAAADVTDRLSLERQLTEAQKLESVGQLAAGIAHEINTPTQFVGDNTRFLRDACDDLQPLFDSHERLLAAAETGSIPEDVINNARNIISQSDINYLREEIPSAIGQTLDGIERVTSIVRAMKEFSHPGSGSKEPTDLNRALQSTTTVARNEWKYAADLKLELDQDLPPVPCLAGELNQAFLNIIVNAAHAIEEATDGQEMGVITIATSFDQDWAEVRISDTGSGIPDDIRARIFDPFFTTKHVGRGTGQGLAIARSVIVDRHGGALDVQSEPGIGTTFTIRLPIHIQAIEAA